MKRKQKITEFFFNEQDSIAEVFTHNTDLKKRLSQYAQTYDENPAVGKCITNLKRSPGA